MNKSSKEMNLSSIITQVSKEDDNNNRSMPLTTTVVNSGTSQAANDTKSTS
jgi:hypothetical protein